MSNEHGDVIAQALGEELPVTTSESHVNEERRVDEQARVATGLTESKEPPPSEEVTKEPEEFTPKKLRELMRLYFTVRHPRVRGCGHKLDLNRDPRHNCESCWFSYLKEHGELVQTADECFVKEGRAMLERIRGKRFVKFFVRFMSTLAHFRALQLAEQEKNGSNSGQSSGNDSGQEGTGSGTISSAPDVGGQVEDIESSRRGAEQAA